MAKEFGKVTAVTEEPIGTTLSVASIAGDTQITVDDVTKLAWPNGGLQIGDEVTFERRVYSVGVAPNEDVDVINTDDDDDPESGTLSLFDEDGAPLALANSYDVDTKVIQFPEVTETIATVLLPDQEEELDLRVPEQLVDLLPTDIRFDQQGTSGTSETVELEESDSEYVITDVVSGQGNGQTRAYASVVAPMDITGTPTDPTVIATADIDIPNTTHRLLFWYFARVNSDTGMVVDIGFDDEGFDFPVTGDFKLASFNPDFSPGPVDALPLLSPIEQGTGWVNPNEAAFGVTADLRSVATGVMPYGLVEPTPGTHRFRLVGWIDDASVGVGVGHLLSARFWAALL